MQGSETRTVKQFHYTKWPDEGIPEDPQVLINFIRFVNEQTQENDSHLRPLLIHCRYYECEISIQYATEYFCTNAARNRSISNLLFKLLQLLGEVI